MKISQMKEIINASESALSSMDSAISLMKETKRVFIEAMELKIIPDVIKRQFRESCAQVESVRESFFNIKPIIIFDEYTDKVAEFTMMCKEVDQLVEKLNEKM